MPTDIPRDFCMDSQPEGRENTQRHLVLGFTVQATEPSLWSIQPIKCEALFISPSTGVYLRNHCLLNSSQSALNSFSIDCTSPLQTQSLNSSVYQNSTSFEKYMYVYERCSTYGDIKMKN